MVHAFSVLRLPTKNHKQIVCATNTKSMGISSCSSLPELNVLLLYLVAAYGFPPQVVFCVCFFFLILSSTHHHTPTQLLAVEFFHLLNLPCILVSWLVF